jgi:APA family basic amino acid/polyamine antiporter
VARLAQRIGLFDATMIVVGGIVGAGIFMNPHVVAARAGSGALALGAWGLGGLVALAGAFVYAELAARRPEAGGQYAYLREAHHPALAFLYGWSLLLVIQTGGMAAVAITFARYAIELGHLTLRPSWLAAIALAALTAINCIGVRTGTAVQSTLTVLKIAAIAGLVACGLFIAPRAPAETLAPAASSSLGLGAVLAPVIFAYGGWQTSGFVAAELRAPRRDLPRALLFGVALVIVLYLAVNVASLRALGLSTLAREEAPASAVMRLALGERGATLIALGIAVSTLGFLSQSILTAPRVYYAMAQDGLFFRAIGAVNARTHVPIAAILLQGACAIAIAATGRYEQILDFMVPVEAAFYAITGTCLFVLRRRDAAANPPTVGAGRIVPVLFVLAFALLAVSVTIASPGRALVGFAIVAAGLPAYWLWRRRA